MNAPAQLRTERELLPCPFCGDAGDKGIVEYVAPQTGATWQQVKCRGCGATCSLTAWNTRALLAVERKPDIAPPQQEWIKVSERLPKNSVDLTVLVHGKQSYLTGEAMWTATAAGLHDAAWVKTYEVDAWRYVDDLLDTLPPAGEKS